MGVLNMMGGGVSGGLSYMNDAQARDYVRREQLGQIRSDFSRAADSASHRAMGDVATASRGSGNVALTSRQVGAASAQAQGQVFAGQAGALANARIQQAQAELQRRQQEQQRSQQMIGGLLGAGGQILGMAVPAVGAVRSAAGATGISGALGQSGGVGSLLGSALGGGAGAGGIGGLLGGLGGGQQPQPQMAAAPQMPQQQPSLGTSDAQGMTLPTGGAETPEERWRRLQAGSFSGLGI